MLLSNEQIDEIETSAIERLDIMADDPIAQEILNNQLSLIETLRDAWEGWDSQSKRQPDHQPPQEERHSKRKRPAVGSVVFYIIFVVLAASLAWEVFGMNNMQQITSNPEQINIEPGSTVITHNN